MHIYTSSETGNEKDILSRLDRIESNLKSIASGNASVKPLTLPEAAVYLGLSRSHLYKLTSKGRIPHYKPQGKRIYFEKSELDSWLLRTPVKTKCQLEDQAESYVLQGTFGISQPQAKGNVGWSRKPKRNGEPVTRGGQSK